MRASSFTVAAFLAFVACGPGSKSSGEGLMTIEVQPPNATITYTGTPATLDYKAIGHYADGHTAEIPDAVFSLDSAGTALGTIDTATFTATGGAAGKGGVFAQVGMVSGSTSVLVVVHSVHLGTDVPANGADNFPDTSPPGPLSPTIVYPLNGAVMPSSVRAPDVQWEGAGTAGDLYRVRLVAGYATVDTILAVSPGFKFDAQPTAADWRLLVASAGTGEITTSVDHWDATNGAAGGTPVAMRMITADIAGSIYYWNLGQGQMEKIDASGHSAAIPNPPASPADPNNHCVACHTVSHDGRYLSGGLWGGGSQGGVFDMSDPAVKMGNPAPTLAPLSDTSYKVLFSTFNADASRLMVNNVTGLALIDPRTGATVPTAGVPLPTANAAHPAWSPDGSSVAFINNITGGGGPAGWAVDYDHGDLQVIPASAGDTFGAPVQLVPSAAVDPAFSAPSWPTFSPDSQYIAYGAGNNSRGRNGATVYPGSLFVINKAGGVTLRLDTACSNARNCYLPNFSPYDAGGYFWLVFYSFRDYGNALAGTKGTGRRQMWIVALDKAKLAAGVDPSAVPYWLPDQDVHTDNMSAFWALPPPVQ